MDTHALANIRREYGHDGLDEKEMCASPFLQFEHWFQEACLYEHEDANAMVLSTVDASGFPNARVVLLKGIQEQAFVFYTNYNSQKSAEIGEHPYAALTFYWPKLSRQVRIRGLIKRTSDAISDAYFASRPRLSQLSALVSTQSKILENREVLESEFKDLVAQYENKIIERPSYWGGYALTPQSVEFWQGRDNRLHDRIQYNLQDSGWDICRLFP